MSWILLIVAGLLEAFWAVGLKYTHGFTRLVPSCFVAAAIVGSMVLLAIAVRDLPIGLAYAAWVSIGIIGAAIAQPVLFHEPIRPAQILFLALLLISIVGLKLTARAS
jgi:quaternary ammonium compound-resistance protein SugE